MPLNDQISSNDEIEVIEDLTKEAFLNDLNNFLNTHPLFSDYLAKKNAKEKLCCSLDHQSKDEKLGESELAKECRSCEGVGDNVEDGSLLFSNIACEIS